MLCLTIDSFRKEVILMRLGILVENKDIKDPIMKAHTGDVLFSEIGILNSSNIDSKLEVASRVYIDVFYISLDAFQDESLFIRSLKNFRIKRPHTRIIIIAIDRTIGDRTISSLVNMGVYDILSPSTDNIGDDDVIDLEYYIRQQLDHPASFADAVRWDLKDNEALPQQKNNIFSSIKKLEDNIRDKKHTFSVLPNKTIVIGSLYPGAGSTFVTTSIARMLHSLGIPNVVIESPVNTPELYSMLYGDKYAPKTNSDRPEYPFLDDQIINQGRMTHSDVQWKSGYTTWFPANPLGLNKNKWTYEHTYKMLLSVKCPIILYDISHHWDHSSVQNICLDADEILFVSDTFPSKLDGTDTSVNSKTLFELNKLGKSVNIVANRDINTDFRDQRKEWIHSLPIMPICTHPYIPYQDVIEAMWDGKVIQDDPVIISNLIPLLYPLLFKIVPSSFPLQPFPKKKKNFFKNIFNK